MGRSNFLSEVRFVIYLARTTQIVTAASASDPSDDEILGRSDLTKVSDFDAGHGRGGGEGVRVRDHLANVRTFLAWLRAGIVLFAIGYATVKFQVSESLPNRYVGVLASIAGWLAILIAGLNFMRQRRAIESPAFRPSIAGNVILSTVTAIAGVTVLVYLMRS